MARSYLIEVRGDPHEYLTGKGYEQLRNRTGEYHKPINEHKRFHAIIGPKIRGIMTRDIRVHLDHKKHQAQRYLSLEMYEEWVRLMPKKPTQKERRKVKREIIYREEIHRKKLQQKVVDSTMK